MGLSRAATAGVGLMGGALGLGVFLMTRGLPDDAKASAARTTEWLKAARAEVATAQQTLDAVVKEDTAYLSPQPEVAAAKKAYADRLAAIDAIEKGIEADIKPILKKDDYDDRITLYTRLASVEAKLLKTPADFSQKLSDVYKVRNYKRDHDKLIKGARHHLEYAKFRINEPSLKPLLEEAQTQYPDVSEKIQNRYEAQLKAAGQLAERGAALNTALGEQPLDYAKAGRLAETVQKEGTAIAAAIGSLRGDIAGLGKSTDKIIVDMKQEGSRCFHKYRYVENGLSRRTDWETVPCSEYRKHTEHLGMAIYSKPEGTFKSEAVTVAHPPGYSYIGNRRYGYWDGGLWRWYGQYALTRDLLWGVGGYRPMRRNTWSSYRSSVKARKPYFGATKQYGSSGSLTKTKYKSSNFLTKRRQTFKASRYRGGSGGGYRDFSSGSRRSGSTYRSNRYRSSSFGGSGK
jgi:hypothetical protein